MLYCDNYLQYIHPMNRYKICTNHYLYKQFALAYKVLLFRGISSLLSSITYIITIDEKKYVKLIKNFTYLSHRSVNFCFKMH